MVDSRQKGARAEAAAKKILKDYTGMNWQRIPASGALSVEHQLKGDLYVAGEYNNYCVEVKHYKDDQLTSKILTSAKPIFYDWWQQAERQGTQVNKTPVLLFKYDRSKFFVAVQDEPSSIDYDYMYLSSYDIFIAKLEDWLEHEDIKWVK